MERMLLSMATAAMVAGCSGGSSAPGTGVLSLSVSDAPIQSARQVCIEFSEAEFKNAGADNQVVVFDPPAKIDLLAYQGMNSAPLFVDTVLEAGSYQWIRLGVNAPVNGNGGAGAGSMDTECVGSGSYIVNDDGSVHGLYVPSGAETGLKLNRGFTLPVGGEADFVAEFDLMSSVHDPQGINPEYILRPTIRLTDRVEAGSIAGIVATDLATAEQCLPAVYLFASGDQPDDLEDDDPMDSVDPIASAMVSMQNDGSYRYEIGPVIEGTYDLAFSCDDDDPIEEDDLNYVASVNNPVTVISGQQATADFD